MGLNGEQNWTLPEVDDGKSSMRQVRKRQRMMMRKMTLTMGSSGDLAMMRM